jgi:general secretion pathway protein B
VLNYRGIPPAAEKSRIIPIAALVLLGSAAVACFFYFKTPHLPKIDAPAQREPLRQELTPITPPQPLQPPRPEPPAPKNHPREVHSPAVPVKPSADAGMIKQKNGNDGIIVSGIAWQDERPLRRAVINGFLVEEGSVIQGARIIEIKESRVRFSRGDEVFEVVHSSGTGK